MLTLATKSTSLWLVLAIFVVTLLFGAVPTTCLADSMTGYYFVLPAGYPDVEHGIDGGTVKGLVNSTLGPDGLPVASTFGLTYSGPSGPITEVNASNELLWWTAGHDGVTYWKTQTDTLPLTFTSNLFPFGNPCDGPCGGGYVAAYWTGTFTLASPGTVTFNLGSDDDAWVFVDGKLQVDNGGVHAFLSTPTVTSPLSAGVHTIDLFFADRHTVQSGIGFSADVVITSTPEPATMLLVGSGISLLGLRLRKYWM